MKRVVLFAVLMAACAAPAFAGNVYGSIAADGKPVAKGVKIEVACGAKSYATESDANGAFKVFVADTGKCVLKVTFGGQTPAFDISSYEGSVQYDLILEKKDGKYTLKRK